MAHEYAQVVDEQWVSFPGGELDGKRPKSLCRACREALKREAVAPTRPTRPTRPLCFQCYRADLDRERAFATAGDLDTASEVRFQFQLPIEPVNLARLASLKAARAEMRAASSLGVGQYTDKRRQAQIAARHALQAIAAGLTARRLAPEALTAATHAAELQLPESWLPFVVSR